MTVGLIEEAFERDRREAPPLTEAEILQHDEYRQKAEVGALEREREAEIDLQKLASMTEQFDIVAAYKINLSGMSSRSSGSGSRRNSVLHGLTLKPLRLKYTDRVVRSRCLVS